MKTQKKLIEIYTKNLEKVISAHGLNNDYFLYATFLLTGINIGIEFKNIFNYADKKMKEINEDTLCK